MIGTSGFFTALECIKFVAALPRPRSWFKGTILLRGREKGWPPKANSWIRPSAYQFFGFSHFPLFFLFLFTVPCSKLSWLPSAFERRWKSSLNWYSVVSSNVLCSKKYYNRHEKHQTEKREQLHQTGQCQACCTYLASLSLFEFKVR